MTVGPASQDRETDRQRDRDTRQRDRRTHAFSSEPPLDDFDGAGLFVGDAARSPGHGRLTNIKR